MNITINQGNIQENITSAIIIKLYQLATDNVNTVMLSGNLYSPTGYAYQVDYLNATFNPNFTLTVPDTGKYIYFEDTAVETILKNAGISSDGIGISVQDANRATLTSNTFAGNSAITSFDGFSYFTRANTNPPNNLFYNCSSLSQIDMSNITTIAQNEFRATAIEDVNAPNLALLTGDYQFGDNQNLITITNLGNITSISQYFAYNCKNLESVVLPQSCTTIAKDAFQNSSALSDINLSNITNIGNTAFKNCTQLAVNIADLQNCTSIGDYAFQNTKQIVGDVSLPNLLTTGNGIFRETNGIQKVTSLGKLSKIPDDCFMNPKDGNSLKEVYIPYECTEIGIKAFQYNRSLTTIKQYTESVDNWIDGQPSAYGECTRITKLNNNCFDGCESLTNLELGNITFIPYRAFAKCKSIQHLNIQFENLISVSSESFRECNSLNWGVQRYTGQYFHQSTDANGDPADDAMQMFSGNTFKQFYLPNLKTSGKNCSYRNWYSCLSYFGSSGGRQNSSYGLLYLKNIDSLFPGTFANANIISLVFNNSTPPVCYNYNKQATVSNDNSKNGVFGSMPNTVKIYVPDASISDYKTADVWSTIASQIYPMSDLTRYATEADWRAAGEPDTGLIEAYM